MMTDADIKKLKESFKDTFATKDDLKSLATKDDIESVKKSLQTMNKKLDLTISFFDKGTSSHEPRIKAIESQLGITLAQN